MEKMCFKKTYMPIIENLENAEKYKEENASDV